MCVTWELEEVSDDRKGYIKVGVSDDEDGIGLIILNLTWK